MIGLLWLVACGPDPRVTPPDGLPPTAKVDVWREMALDDVAARHPSDGGGRAVLVRSDGEVHDLRYTVGPAGVAVGGSVWFQSPPFWGWAPAQLDAPDAPGFVEVVGPGLDVAVVGEGLVRAVVRDRPLVAGDVIDVRYGPARDRYAERGQALAFWVDGDGDGVRALVPDPPRVDSPPGPAVGVIVTAPSTARPGDAVRVTIAALDASGSAGAPLAGELRIDADGLGLPATVTLDDHGLATLEGRAGDVGVHGVLVTLPDGRRVLSNPVVVHPDAQPILWGDLQVHTGLSDGTGTLDDAHRYARDVANLDVVAITDHDHWGQGFLDRDPGRWAEVVATAARWDEPGRFVAFPAYEWTSWLYGHRHVLYVGAPGPVLGALDVATRTPEGLRTALAGVDALVIPHHPAGGPIAVDLGTTPDPRLEPVLELCSVHGSSEADDTPGRIDDFVPGHTARDALATGWRVGLLCSGDGHDGHPGLAHLQGGRGGVAAILTADRTRAGVAAALRERRVYGTNGPRIVLRVEAGGRPMGTELPPGDVDVEVRAVGTAPIVAVELVRDGIVVERREPGAYAARELLPLRGLGPVGWAYVRVIQADGGAAWSSPFFGAPAR